MASTDDLTAFQSALLDLLSRDLSSAEMQAKLRSDAAFACYHEYVQAMEPRMLEVAVELVKKWGKRQV